MKVIIAGFDWDIGNWPKCGKHGVSKEEIEEAFSLSPKIMPDPFTGEPRIRLIGKTKNNRYLFIVFTFRIINQQTFVRPISARYMHQKEVIHYEQTIFKKDAWLKN